MLSAWTYFNHFCIRVYKIGIRAGTRAFSSTTLLLLFITAFSFDSLAAISGPQTITIDARLFTSLTSDTPLLDASVVVNIKIYNPDATCILYEEQQTADTTMNEGRFTILVGSNTLTGGKRVSGEPGNSMAKVFQNASSIPGSCGTYAPAPGDVRKIRITVSPSSTGLSEVLSPDTIIDSVPNALVAETLQGLAPTNFVQIDTASLTQTNVANIFSATNYPLLTALLGGTSSSYVTSSASGATLPTVAGVPTSLAQGQIWFNSSANAFQYYNGSAVQSLGVSGSGISALTVGSSLTASGVAGGTLNSSGTIDLVNSGVSAGTYPLVTVNSKGLVTYGSGLTESYIPTLTTAGHVLGDAITSGTIGGTTAFYSSGNVTTTGTVQGTNVTSVVDLTRKLSIYGSGGGNSVSFTAPTMSSDYAVIFPGVQGAAGTTLVNDGNGNLSWSAGLSDPTVQKTALASGKIWIGGTGGVATAVTPFGDINLSIAGSATVTQIQGLPVSATAPAGAGQMLRWNGTAWTPNFVGMADLRSNVTGALSLTGCTAAQTLVFSSATDSLMCSNIAIANTQVAWGSTGANLVFAGPSTGGAAAPTFRALTATDLPAGTASQWNTVSSTINYVAGAVGIGTATPNAQLHVKANSTGGVLVLQNSNSTGYVSTDLVDAGGNSKAGFGWGNSGSSIWTSSAYFNTSGTDPVILGTNNLERLRISGAGNIGINTTNPQAILDVNGLGAQSAIIVPRDTSGNRPTTPINGMIRYATDLARLETYSSGAWTGITTGAGGTSSQWTTSGTTIYYNSTGSVGIGSASPTATLDVAGSLRASSISSGPANFQGILDVGYFGASIVYNGNNLFRVNGNPTGGNGYVMQIEGGNPSTSAFALKVTSNSNLISSIDLAGNMFVSKSIGIGTTAALTGLDISTTGSLSAILVPRDTTLNRPTGINGMIRYNNSLSQMEMFSSGAWSGIAAGSAGSGGGSASGVAGAIQFSGGSGAFSADASNLFYDSSTHRLGIGTSSPVATIDAGSGDLTGSRFFPKGGGVSAPDYAFNHSGSGNSMGMFYIAQDVFAFATAATERMRIDSTGKVGIGTNNPSSTLQVNGNLTVLQTTETAVNLGSSLTGTVNINLATGSYFYGTITGATTFTTSGFAASGSVSSFTLELVNGGSQTLTWMSGTKWPGGTPPTFTTSGTDLVVCSTRDGAVTWRCVGSEMNSF